MNAIHKTILVIFVALLAACGKSPSSSPKDSPQSPSPVSQAPQPVEPKPFHGKVFRSLNKELVITLVSSDELELGSRGTTYLCKYTEQDDALRVILTAGGANQVLYFRHVPDGLLSNDGMVLFSSERYTDRLVDGCLSNAKQIGTACVLYAVDHQGAFPKDLNQLVPDYLPNGGIFSSPLAPRPGNLDYEYFGAAVNAYDDVADKILLRSRYTTTDGKRSVVRHDSRGIRGVIER